MKISSETPILVTGGASGLGLAVVEKFSAMGAKVAIFDMNVEEGNRILKNSNLKIITASDLSDAAKKIVSAIK